jgi:hypothetical protein
MDSIVKLSQNTQSLGRNGMIITTAIDIHKNLWNEGATLTIAPITSKGLEGRCSIEIPVADLPQLIIELKSIYLQGSLT